MAVSSRVCFRPEPAWRLLDSRWRAFVPLALLLGLVQLLAHGLQGDPRALPSALLGNPAPVIELPEVGAPQRLFTSKTLQGQPWVLHVWASWYAPSREELPQLQQLAEHGVTMIGLNYKDDAIAAQRWLQVAGRSPFGVTAQDIDGRAALVWGVSTVPETFIVDAQGIVRWRFAGVLTPQVIQRELLPLWRKLHR